MDVAPADFATLLTNLGFNANARTVMTDPAREGLDLGTIALWSDEDVDQLVRTLRKTDQGGTLVYVKVSAIEDLKTACFILRHLDRCQRAVLPNRHGLAHLTQNMVKNWKTLRLQEAAYEDPTEFPKLAKGDPATILDFIEEFPENIARFTGSDGRSLGYILRDDDAVPPEADDPIFGHADSTYSSPRDETIGRAEMAGAGYRVDNKKVFEILRDAIAPFDDVKVWVKGFVRAKDGRGAWKAFTAHYLGDAQLDSIAERADQRIESLVYNGEKTRYSFEDHVSNFKKAFLDLEKSGSKPDG